MGKSSQSHAKRSDKETQSPMLKIFKDIMQREKTSEKDTEKVNLIEEKRKTKKKRRDDDKKTTSSHKSVSIKKTLDSSGTEGRARWMLQQYNANVEPLKTSNTFINQQTSPFPCDKKDSWCVWEVDKRNDSGSCSMTCALRRLLNNDFACVACLIFLFTVTAVVAFLMLFKTLPMVAVSTPAPAMRHFDAYRGEALRREIDQLDRRELDEEKFLARRSVGRELYDKNSFPDITVNEFGEPRASRWRFKKGKGSNIVTPNFEKLEAGSKLREFYKKLLDTDAKIQKLRSVVPGRNIYAGARNFADRVKRSLFHWKHKEGKHKGNATKPKSPKKLAPKKTQIHKKYNVHFKNSTKGHEKVNLPMRSRRHLNSTETPGLIFEKKKLLVKYVPKNLKLARLSTIMRNFKQTNDEPTIFDDFFDQFVDKKVTWKETNTASPFVDKLITYRSSLQETTPWYPFHAFYTTSGNLYRQYVKPTMFRAKNFKYNFLRKPEKKPDDMRNTATTLIDTMKRESSTRKFTTTIRKTTTPETTSTMPMITNYDMLISISTLMRSGVSEFLNLVPARRLMQAEEEDQEGIGYEDFKEVLSDEMEGHDDTDKKIDRMKRDEPENKPFNLEDKKFLDNSRRYNPPLYHNPNWKGPMPLYPDELNTMIKTAVMQNMNKELPDMSVLSKKEVGETDFQSDALDTQYIEDYFNNKYEKLVKMAQAYSDYGVLEGKKGFQRSEKAQAAVKAVKADRVKMSLDQMLEPGVEKSAQPGGYEGFKITFSGKPAEGNQVQGTKPQKLVSPVTSLVETSPMTTTSENQDMQQMDNSDKNTFDETFSMGLFKRSLKSVDVDDIDYNHLSRDFKRSLKSVDADEADYKQLSRSYRHALASDDADNSYLDPSKDYFDGPRLYHMKMAQAYSDYGVLEGKKEVQRYEKSQADNAKSERYKMSLARQLEPTMEKHAEGFKDGFKFSFSNKPMDSKPISKSSSVKPDMDESGYRMNRLSEKAVDKPAPEHEGFRISFSRKSAGNKNTRNSYDDMYAMSRFRRSLKSIDADDIDYTDMFRVYIDGPNSYNMDSEKYVLDSERASTFRRSIINELLDYENAYDSKRILKRSILSEIEDINDQSRKNGYNHNPIVHVDNDWVVLDDIETLVEMVSEQNEFKDDDKDKKTSEPYRDNVYENKTINIEDLEEKIRNFVKLTNLVSENVTNVQNNKNGAVNESETEDKLNDVSKLKRSVKTEGEEYYDRDYDDDDRDNIDNVFVTVYRGSYSTKGNEISSDKTSELHKQVSSTETLNNATDISLATDSKTALATDSKTALATDSKTALATDSNTVSATVSKANTTAVVQANVTEEATTAMITNDNATLHTDIMNATSKDLAVIAVKREYTSKTTVKDVVNTVKMEDKTSGNKTASNPLDFFMMLSNWFGTLAGFMFNVNNTITNPQTHIIQLLKELNKPNATVAQTTTQRTPEMAYPMYDADGIENIGHRSRVLMSIDETNATEKMETSDGTSNIGVKGTAFSSPLMPSPDTPEATTVLEQINITESTKPLAINATGDKAQLNKNKTLVKRDINIEDSNLIFWNDLYDDEYGVNVDPMEKALNGKARVESDILKKSENWLQEKMRKLKDTVKKKSRDSFERILHGKRRRRARAAFGLQKKFERSDAEELEEQEHKKGFALLTAHMRQVCKKAAKTVDEIRNMEVQKPLPEDAVPSGLMQQMVRLLSDLVDYQVQMRSCIKLPDHLRSFLVWLTSPQIQQQAPQQPVQQPAQHPVQRSLAAQKGAPEASSQKPKKQQTSENASPPMDSLAEDHRPTTTETERPDARSDCLGTLRAVVDLIHEYDGMGDEDKSKMVGVKEYLQNQLNFLRLLNDQRGMNYPRKIRRRRRIMDPKLLRRQKKHCKVATEPVGVQKPVKYKGRLEKFIRNFGKKHTKSTADSYDNFQVSAETCKKGNIVDTVDKFMEAIDEIDPQKLQRILRATGDQKKDPVEGFHNSLTTDRPTTLRVQKENLDSPKVVMLK